MKSFNTKFFLIYIFLILQDGNEFYFEVETDFYLYSFIGKM